jgi:hypothetical protein
MHCSGFTEIPTLKPPLVILYDQHNGSWNDKVDAEFHVSELFTVGRSYYGQKA